MRGAQRSLRTYWRCLRDGSAAGLLGGAAVVALFFVYDLVRLEPFATPAFLSTAFLGGGSREGDLGVFMTIAALITGTGRIIVYSLLHLLVFGLLGVGAALMFLWTDEPPKVLSGALYGLLVCSLVFYVAIGVTGALSGVPDWRAVALGNLFAGGVMGRYLAGKEAQLGSRLSSLDFHGGDETL
jgi:hypothetical protein